MSFHPGSKASPPRIAIVGAGMTGLRCDQLLREHGLQATVFDKSRGSSGRMATRRVGEALRFDHGAQYITAHGEGFALWLQERQAEGAAAVWQPRLPADAHRPSHDWWVGTPGMADLLRPLARQADLQLQITVTGVERRDHRWVLSTGAGDWPEPFDIVVITLPAKQAQTLLGAEPLLRDALDAVKTEPCWTLMLDFATPLALDFDAQRLDEGALSWLGRQGSRPGATKAQDNAWTLHASSGWSEQHLHVPPEQTSELLQHELAHLIGASLPAVAFVQAHRWLYARTSTPLEQPMLCNDDASLFVGGDWCLGARVEYAFDSGSAIAKKIIDGRRASGE